MSLSRIELNKIYNSKKRVKNGIEKASFDDFLVWFNESNFKDGCHYCGLTNEESSKLYYMQRTGIRPDATRGGKRGRRLELDRKNPNLSYDDLGNLVWCCYWCNNAKTNFFDKKEFRKIGEQIGHELKKILNDENR